jgi:NOL1/NOP2/fmu family ribosome biogenesis protein
VTNETPEKLAGAFPGFFDRIIVDAPCSGEGMFRKDEDAARSWEKFKCEACAGMQSTILKSVDEMLKPGGTLVYSTCTFSPEEDEKMIAAFLADHPDYVVEAIPKVGGIADGKPEWADGNGRLSGTARLWPHRVKGEGHFVAKLRKGNAISSGDSDCYDERISSDKIPEEFLSFMRENLNIMVEGSFFTKGKNLYNLPVEPPVLDGLKVAKFGWFLGELVNGRYEPSHSMVAALKAGDIKRVLELPADSRDVLGYLKGETLMLEGEKGFTAVCTGGRTLGWAKQTGDMLKNLYPKGWRKMN